MPTHSDLLSKVTIKVMLQLTVGQSVLVSGIHLGPMTRFVLLSDSCGFVYMGCGLRWKDGSAVYNAAGPYQHSHSQVKVSRDSWLYFTMSNLRLPLTWMALSLYLYPTRIGWPSYTPRHWVSPTPFTVSTYTRNLLVWTFHHSSVVIKHDLLPSNYWSYCCMLGGCCQGKCVYVIICMYSGVLSNPHWVCC
jgi:hypothetical protein